MQNLDKLKRKVSAEKAQGFEHIRNERERKRNILEKLLPVDIPEGQVRVNLLWKNLQLERALFVSDKLNVKFLCNDSVIGNEVMQKAQKVAEFDDIDMELIHQREDIVDYNGLYWVAITCVDNYDDEEQQPIQATIDPLSVIPDPKNWRGSKMRFIWFERRVSKEYLETAPWYKNINLVNDSNTSQELRLNEQAYNDANRTNIIFDQQGLVDIYDHYTVWEGKKVLTTWANWWDLLIRYVEIETLTNAEKLNPTKVKFPVQIHRRKNKPNSFFWVSIADEILQFQDAITTLTNLQLIQARIAGLWPDKYVDNSLGIDIATVSQKLPWGRVIPVENVNGAIWNAFYIDQTPNPSQFPIQMNNVLESYSQGTTWAWDVAFGTSPGWSQTKAEIQTLMANSNQLLWAVADNYLRGQKEYWEAHYRAYALNMWARDKKVITLYQKGNALSLEIKKQDFIADGKVQVIVESQTQVDKENEKNSAKLLALQWVFLPYIKWDYARNQFLRKLWDSQGIKNFDSTLYIEKSVDEMRAELNLELLNRNEDVAPPQPGEDYRTYLAIYRQALDTPAKNRALFLYEEAIMMEQELWMNTTWWAMWWDEQTKNIAMNMISNQSQQVNTPTLENVTM